MYYFGDMRLYWFQSTSPCRGRLSKVSGATEQGRFQSTSPCRGRQACRYRNAPPTCCFNPRPHVGDDPSTPLVMSPCVRFQSTSPCRGRLSQYLARSRSCLFQSTSPCRGRQSMAIMVPTMIQFQSTSPCRGRRTRRRSSCPRRCFNPRPHVGDDCLAVSC